MNESRVTSTNASLFMRSWPGSKSGTRVFVGHGHATHSGSFIPFCEALHQKGNAVFAGDLRGHGRSADGHNPLGHLDPKTGWEALKTDLVRLTDAAFEDTPFEDRVLIVQNISAHLAMDLMRGGHFFARRIVLVSPVPSRPVLAALARSYIKARMIHRTASVPDEKTLQLVYGFFGAQTGDKRHLADLLTADPEIAGRLADDPLSFPTPTLGYWSAIFSGHAQAWTWPGDLQLPSRTRCLILSGSHDRIARKHHVTEILNAFLSRHGVSADNRVVAGARSNVLIDEGPFPVAQTVAAWLEETAMPRTKPVRQDRRRSSPGNSGVFSLAPDALVELCYGALADGGGWSRIMDRALPDNPAGTDAIPVKLQSLFAGLMPHWERSSELSDAILRKAARAPVLASTLDHLGLGIAVVRQDGSVVLSNSAYRSALESLLGRSCQDDKALAAITASLLLSPDYSGIGAERPLRIGDRIAGYLMVPDAAATGSLPAGVVLLRLPRSREHPQTDSVGGAELARQLQGLSGWLRDPAGRDSLNRG